MAQQDAASPHCAFSLLVSYLHPLCAPSPAPLLVFINLKLPSFVAFLLPIVDAVTCIRRKYKYTCFFCCCCCEQVDTCATCVPEPCPWQLMVAIAIATSLGCVRVCVCLSAHATCKAAAAMHTHAHNGWQSRGMGLSN